MAKPKKKSKAGPKKKTKLARSTPARREPYELIYENILKELRATRMDMHSASWILAVTEQPDEVRREAAIRALDVQAAILELENAELEAIRDKLINNEPGLRAGIAGLSKARERLENVQDVLQKIATVLEVVGKVVVFVATKIP